MTCKLRAEFLGLGVIAIAFPLLGTNSAAESAGQSALQPATQPATQPSTQPRQVTNTQNIEFAPGGTIHINGSYGVLRVEGWDRPEVVVTVTKSLPYGFERKHPDRAMQLLESLRVIAERTSSTELVISTAKSSLGIEYEIQVPRNSNLAIHHRTGLVSVSGVTGDIDATCRRGDLLLWLPQTASYSIDARSKVGTVSSDFPGAFAVRYLIGQRYSHADPSPSRRIYLRARFGGITIKTILPESAAPIAGGR
jgi:hypothetical protein